MPAMWHVYRCIQEHLSLPPTPTFFDLYHRLRAKPIPFPQRQIQMETPCGRYTQSMRLNWSRRFVALAGWENGHLLVWKMRRLGWMVFPSCVSLILHQNGVFLISSLLFLPGSFFFFFYPMREQAWLSKQLQHDGIFATREQAQDTLAFRLRTGSFLSS